MRASVVIWSLTLTAVGVARLLINSVAFADAGTSTSFDDDVAAYNCVPGLNSSWNTRCELLLGDYVTIMEGNVGIVFLATASNTFYRIMVNIEGAYATQAVQTNDQARNVMN